MKNTCYPLALALLLAVSLPSVAQKLVEFDDLERYPVILDALESAMLTVDDITVKRDFVTPDPFRLKISTDWLERPFTIPTRTQEIAESFSKTKKLADIFDEAAELKDNSSRSVEVNLSEPSEETLYANLLKLEILGGDKFKTGERKSKTTLRELPSPVVKALSLLVEGTVIAHEEANKAYTLTKSII